MSPEEKEIQNALRLMRQIAKDRASREDNPLSFTGELQLALRNERNLTDMPTMSFRDLAARAKDATERVVFRLVYGYSRPKLEVEADMHLGDLLSEGRISRDEWQRATAQRIIRRADDGAVYAVGSPGRALVVAKILLVVMAFAVSACVVHLLEEPFHFFHSVAFALILGAVFGRTGKFAYDFAWGQRALATKLRYLLPYLRYRNG